MITLRNIKESDLENLRRWRTSPEVTKYLFTDQAITEEEQQVWYREIKDSMYWIINFKDVEIGYASLNEIDTKNRTADPGVYIGELEYRGIGLGSGILRKIENYAFETLGMHKLHGKVLSENYPALKIYSKNGWQVEGFLKNHILKHDKFFNVYIMSLFRGSR
jgi:UDP-4-amino-4,6-dideoxy-N-acetyl-beta-L-altrosamine N-acetyltransferase